MTKSDPNPAKLMVGIREKSTKGGKIDDGKQFPGWLLVCQEFFLPVRVPLGFSLEVIDKSPSPVSENVTCATHVLNTHSGLPYAPAHDSVRFVTLHDGGERSVSCRF